MHRGAAGGAAVLLPTRVGSKLSGAAAGAGLLEVSLQAALLPPGNAARGRQGRSWRSSQPYTYDLSRA